MTLSSNQNEQLRDAFHALPDEKQARALSWLNTTGSMTQQLMLQSQGCLRHHLNFVGWGQASHVPLSYLQEIPSSEHYWEREIAFTVQGTFWLKARVVIPSSSLRGEGVALHYCGAQSIGPILFSDPAMTRKQVADEFHYDPSTGWAITRHGIYSFYGRPLYIAETFMEPLLFQEKVLA